MRQDSSGGTWKRHSVFPFFFTLFLGFFAGVRKLPAQTQQPFLFATTQVNGSPAVATFTRNDAAGTLAEVAGSPFVLVSLGCYPATIDPQGRFLLGPCASGISLYSFNSSTGAVAEVPNSPFAASTGAEPSAVIAESTGKFAYALRITRSTFPTPSTATLDSFVIDAANSALAQPSSQTFTLPGAYLGVVADPNDHFLQIFVEQESGSGTPPIGGSCTILFDLQTGLPQNTASGICQTSVTNEENPLGISIDARGTFVGTAAAGQNFASFSVLAISPTNGSLQGTGNFTFAETNNSAGTPFFDPVGQLAYVNTQQTGLRIFGLAVAQSAVTITELPSSPLPSALDAAALSGIPDPAAEFTYVGGSNVITTYPIDPATGYPGAPIQNTLTHAPALTFQPAFATMPPPGQPISAPGIIVSTQTLTFGPIHPGQTSGPQTVTISSTGNQALTISSLAFSPSAGPFSETDTCMAQPVLAPGSSCQVSVSYTAGSVGTTNASLVITDNAAGSPQSVTLSGTSVAPPAPAPEVTLVPGTLTFPGTTTQGESSAPMSVGITNSGNVALTFTSAPVLSAANTGDFSITANTCTGSLAANASCSVTIVFLPQAAGVRTTTLAISDNATNSPQSVPISGSAALAATITSPGGASASVSAGQSALYAMQAAAGPGFNGTLTFACSGLPLGTNCAATNVALTGGTTTNFSFTVTTSGSAMLVPRSLPRISARPNTYFEFAMPLLALLICWLYWSARKLSTRGMRGYAWQRAAGLACLALALLGCGGGGGSSAPVGNNTGGGGGGGGSGPPPMVTPSGTYTITLSPTATASGTSKAVPLSPITLTLIVK